MADGKVSSIMTQMSRDVQDSERSKQSDKRLENLLSPDQQRNMLASQTMAKQLKGPVDARA